jgi:hypothetical protein
MKRINHWTNRSPAILAVLALGILGTAAYVASAGINDTGQIFCDDGAELTSCMDAGTGDQLLPSGQDGHDGRDAQAQAGLITKIGGGAGGFDFSPLDQDGAPIAVVQSIPASLPTCIQDNVTGLTWEVKTWDGGLRDREWSYRWPGKNGIAISTPNQERSSCGSDLLGGSCDASAYVAAVNAAGLCGARDWRLPTVRELQGIVSAGDAGPAIDSDYFPNTQAGSYWAATPDAADTARAWRVDFDRGDSGTEVSSNFSGIRLVRGDQVPDTFTDHGDGTVTHGPSGLTWAQCSEGQQGPSCESGSATAMTWTEALPAARESRLAGYGDWRLPNKKELQSLVDYRRYSPAIDETYFPKTHDDRYWTSTSDLSDPALAAYVDFIDGADDSVDKLNRLSVRFVRGGDSPAPSYTKGLGEGSSNGSEAANFATLKTVSHEQVIGNWTTSQGKRFAINEGNVMSGLAIDVNAGGASVCGVTVPSVFTATFSDIHVTETGHFPSAYFSTSDRYTSISTTLNSGQFGGDGTSVTFRFNYNRETRVGGCTAISSGSGSVTATRPAPRINTAVLPYARAVAIGETATAFASVINSGNLTATGCSLALPDGLTAPFSYQTTNAANALIGAADEPVDIPPGTTQGFVFGITPSQAMAATEIPLVFDCTNTAPAPSHPGLNTFILSAAATAPPDLLAIGATPSGDGVVHLPSSTGIGFFATAAVNIGSAGDITVSADDGGRGLPLALQVCETTPAGQWIVCGNSLTRTIGAAQTAYYTVFATGTDQPIAFDPANNRLFLRFAANGTTVGATNVAVTAP